MAIHTDDLNLVRRLRRGDQRAFEAFFSEYFSRLYRFALPRVRHDEQAAAELVQASLSRAVHKLHSYRGEAALFSWLCAICRNCLIDQARSERSYQQHIVLVEDDTEFQAVAESLAANESTGPERQQEKSEQARLVHVALDHLPARYGNALEWKYIEGFSVTEIAQRLALSREATQSLLARARRAFAEIYPALLQARQRANNAQAPEVPRHV